MPALTCLQAVHQNNNKPTLTESGRATAQRTGRFSEEFQHMDHIFTIFPLCIAFVDYEKALDSIEINTVLNALAEQGIDTNDIKLLKEAN